MEMGAYYRTKLVHIKVFLATTSIMPRSHAGDAVVTSEIQVSLVLANSQHTNHLKF
jgi:hypothetical protein